MSATQVISQDMLDEIYGDPFAFLVGTYSCSTCMFWLVLAGIAAALVRNSFISSSSFPLCRFADLSHCTLGTIAASHHIDSDVS